MPTIEQARSWYRDDPVHGYDHVLRVYAMAERLAAAEGADLEIVRAAALLHDAEDPNLSEADRRRATHHLASAAFARRVLEQDGWVEQRITAVEHCIRSHRFRDPQEQPLTLEAQVLFDADKLDAIGVIGAARAVAYAAAHGEPAYTRPSQQFLETGRAEPGERHSAYHEYRFKLIHLNNRLFTSTARNIGEQRHQEMVAFFETLAFEAGE